jgi:hypothetical protein
VVRIEGGVVKKCKSVVKTLKTVVENKQFMGSTLCPGPLVIIVGGDGRRGPAARPTQRQRRENDQHEHVHHLGLVQPAQSPSTGVVSPSG